MLAGLSTGCTDDQFVAKQQPVVELRGCSAVSATHVQYLRAFIANEFHKNGNDLVISALEKEFGGSVNEISESEVVGYPVGSQTDRFRFIIKEPGTAFLVGYEDPDKDVCTTIFSEQNIINEDANGF
jgi:hypothetical protein